MSLFYSVYFYIVKAFENLHYVYDTFQLYFMDLPPPFQLLSMDNKLYRSNKVQLPSFYTNWHL